MDDGGADDASAGGSSGAGGRSSGGGAAGIGGSAGAGGSSGGAAGMGGAAGTGGSAAGAAGRDGGACPVGTEGCPCNGNSCVGALVCRGTTCAKVVCGDHRIEGSEVCDDGMNLGAAVGDCAPDCSKFVDQKRILQSGAGVRADFARNGTGALVSTADSYCPAGFKAIFSAAGQRVASTTPYGGTGQVDWALKPWTRYVNSSGQPIWLTNKTALLGVSSTGFSGLLNAIVPGSNSGYITGMKADYTDLAAGRNCNGWASATTAAQGMIGIGGATDARFLEQAPDFTYPCSDVTNWRLYCAEQ
jgi:hypothetical protein